MQSRGYTVFTVRPLFCVLLFPSERSAGGTAAIRRASSAYGNALCAAASVPVIGAAFRRTAYFRIDLRSSVKTVLKASPALGKALAAGVAFGAGILARHTDLSPAAPVAAVADAV